MLDNGIFTATANSLNVTMEGLTTLLLWSDTNRTIIGNFSIHGDLHGELQDIFTCLMETLAMFANMEVCMPT